ncbi:MAG: hypothetical protein L6Q84_00490 [Polyangiaceae bacterium]|nr:hypothetical protein [Polyangiaceae bacterium]
MSDGLRRVAGTSAHAIHDWLEQTELRRSDAKPASPSRAESPAVAQLKNRPSPATVGARLDDFRRQAEASYQVDGKTVRVSAAFCTLHGGPAKQGGYVAAIKKALGPERFRELAPKALAATSTRGTPEDIRITTQALLDAGVAKDLLAKRPDLSPEQAVRVVMGAYGIGLDCRGYALRAFLHARGNGSVPARMDRYFDKDAGNVLFQHEGRMRRVATDLSVARPGDIIRLKPGADGRDHNVIVRSNELRRLPETGEMMVLGKDVPAGFVTKGAAAGAEPSVRVVTVDAAWGDGGDPTLGGVRRMAWLYNEKSGEWGHWDRFGAFRTSSGPYDHSLDGVYRPRGET